jgi:hypothetical protein
MGSLAASLLMGSRLIESEWFEQTASDRKTEIFQMRRILSHAGHTIEHRSGGEMNWRPVSGFRNAQYNRGCSVREAASIHCFRTYWSSVGH